MAATRSRKRSAPDGEGDVAATDAEAIDPEEVLAAASQVRARKVKERRVEAHRKKPQFEILCDQGVVPIIFAMLDSARDVYNLAFTSKYVLSFVTSKIVVRSAVFQGGHTRKALGTIMEAVEKRSIYVPSALRLLRLVNGKVCERLEECWSYDLVRKTPASLAKSSQRPFGLMLCQKCLKGNAISLPYHHFAVSEDRVSVDCRVPNQAHVDPSTGERHGPIVLAKHIKQIESTYKTAEDRTDALREVLERADAEMLDNAESSESTQALLEMYTEAESRFAEFLKEKERIASAARRAKEEERTTKRFDRMVKIFETFEAILDGYTHKDFALECTWDKTRGTVFFKHSPTRVVLDPLFNASSSATQKKTKQAAEKIRQVYDMLASKRFLSAGFLSFLSNSPNIMERRLYQHCRRFEHVTPSTLLSDYRCDAPWLCLATEGERVVCLIKLLSLEDFASSFALVAVATAENRDNLCKLAKCAWKKAWHDLGWQRSKEEKWDEAPPIAHTRYRRLRALCAEYLARPSTIEFAENTSPSNDPNQTFTRRNAVETIYVDRLSHLKLLARDFTGLLALQQDYFRHPSRVRDLS